jgi:hypothetical protein
MDRKKITAMIIGCEPGEFMAYADQGEAGTVVVGPDGKKFRFSNDDLDLAEAEFNRKADKKKPVKKKASKDSTRKPALASAKSGTARKREKEVAKTPPNPSAGTKAKK